MATNLWHLISDGHCGEIGGGGRYSVQTWVRSVGPRQQSSQVARVRSRRLRQRVRRGRRAIFVAVYLYILNIYVYVSVAYFKLYQSVRIPRPWRGKSVCARAIFLSFNVLDPVNSGTQFTEFHQRPPSVEPLPQLQLFSRQEWSERYLIYIYVTVGDTLDLVV